MGLDRRELLLDRAVEQTAAVPARDQAQPVPFQDRPQNRRIAGKFVAELDSFEPRELRLGKAGFERRVAAQFRQIVVAPADRANAEAHGHRAQLSLFGCRKLTCGNAGLRPANDACYRVAANRRAEITRMTQQDRSVVVFDLGGVLIDWDPRHLYRKLFAEDEAAMEHFLATVCTHDWNRCQDAGRSFAEGARLLKAEHPDKAELIDAYGARFDEMMAGSIAGSVEILAELRDRGTPLYGLTNWSAETYPPAVERFAFSAGFRGFS